MELAIFGNRYFDHQKPWKTAKENRERTATTVNVSLQIVKALGILLEPFLPDASEKIWHLLNLEEVKKWEFTELPAGHRVRKAFPMFRKVTDGGEIIYFIVNYIGRGNPDSAKILLNKYYKQEDVVKVTLERFGEKRKDEALALLKSIYGDEFKGEKPEKAGKAEKKENVKGGVKRWST